MTNPLGRLLSRTPATADPGLPAAAIDDRVAALPASLIALLFRNVTTPLLASSLVALIVVFVLRDLVPLA
jgi:hypothetical protein